MARLVRRPHLGLALLALVALSTLIHWLTARRFTGLWIMPDEAIYGERALDFWRHGTLSILHGDGAGYSVLYPIVAGIPLALGKLKSGYDALKLLQAFVMSLTALPVFFYGRRLMRPGYALLAAALALASPLVLYSGLIMTEVLIYPLGTLALLAIAYAVETARLRDQAIALLLIAATVLTRVQSVVLVAVLAAAVIVDSLLVRDRRRLRAFWPVWVVLVVVVAATLVSPAVFGAYAGTISGSYPVGLAAGLTIDHLSYLILETGIAPVAALVLLIAEALRRRSAEPAERALLTVAACAVVLVVVQVGLFASRYSPHLLGRDLALLPPILFLVFGLWLDRGAPRRRVIATPLILGIFVLLALTPWHRLVAANALPDTFGIATLYSLGAQHAATAVAVAALVVLMVIAAAPTSAVRVALPLVVLALLVTSSAVAARDIARRVNYDQKYLVGTPPDWVERAVAAPVAYLYDNEPYWNGVWQVRFWNENVRQVVSLFPSRVPGPLRQRVVRLGPDGALPIDARYVVASNSHTFVGTPVAQVKQTGLTQSGLTLWRLDGQPRLSTIENGFLPNGDINWTAQITVYDCGGGQLELTLLPKKTRSLTISLNGKVVQQVSLAGLPFWNGTVYAPPSTKPEVCVFQLAGQELLGSTRIAFVRS
ncbi:MAG TPA: glycosyltransferase family 39 protein [Gaiellaceae bacterium]|nr:glycosyltransferase family 39 protein [Gaiellaceae bacterium]